MIYGFNDTDKSKQPINLKYENGDIIGIESDNSETNITGHNNTLDEYVDLKANYANVDYTAPCDGYLYLESDIDEGFDNYVWINKKDTAQDTQYGFMFSCPIAKTVGSSTRAGRATLFIRKGIKIRYLENIDTELSECKFYPIIPDND